MVLPSNWFLSTTYLNAVLTKSILAKGLGIDVGSRLEKSPSGLWIFSITEGPYASPRSSQCWRFLSWNNLKTFAMIKIVFGLL